MVLGAWRGPNKEEDTAWGERGMKCGMGGIDTITQPQGVCVRRELKRSEQEGCVSSGVSVGVLAGDKRPTQLSVFALLRRLNKELLCRGMGRVKGTNERC